MIDPPFLAVCAVAVLALLGLWFMWAKTFSQHIDLTIAGDELREAHAGLDQLARTAADLTIERDAARLLNRVRLTTIERLTAEAEQRAAVALSRIQAGQDRLEAAITARDEQGRFRETTNADLELLAAEMLRSAATKRAA